MEFFVFLGLLLLSLLKSRLKTNFTIMKMFNYLGIFINNLRNSFMQQTALVSTVQLKVQLYQYGRYFYFNRSTSNKRICHVYIDMILSPQIFGDI